MANLGALRTRVRDYLDEPTAAFWTDAQLNNWINQAYFYYYMELVDAYESYFATTIFYNIVSGLANYPLPADFDKLRLLERVIDGTTTVPLMEFNRLEAPNIISNFTYTNAYLPTFRFYGSEFLLEPTPSVNVANGLRFEYVPAPVTMVLDSDQPNQGFLNHWQETIVLKAVISAKMKEEMVGNQGADLGPFQTMLTTWENKVKEALEQRTMGRRYTEPFGLDETTNYYYP